MESENKEEKTLKCPYCKSMNTKFVNREEEADPDDNGAGGSGTQYTLRKNYLCKDCGCKFYWYKEVTTYTGIDIEEDGEDEFIIHIFVPKYTDWIGYEDVEDVEAYLNFDERDYYDKEANEYHIPKELQWIDDANGLSDCPSIRKDIEDLKASYPNTDIDIDLSYNFGRLDNIEIEIETSSMRELKQIIADGEGSGNSLAHTIYLCLDDYKDDLTDIKEISYLGDGSGEPRIKYR